MKKTIMALATLSSLAFGATSLSLPNGATKLAEQESFDGVLADTYKFLAYKTKDGKEIKIDGLNVSNTFINKKTCTSKMKYNKNNKKAYFLVGSEGLSLKYTTDNRIVEHRLFCDKNTGKATKVEMFLQTRNADGSAKKPLINSFNISFK
jgi:hypothetical protein